MFTPTCDMGGRGVRQHHHHHDGDVCSTTFTISAPCSDTIHSHYVTTNTATNRQSTWFAHTHKKNALPTSSQDQLLTVVVTCTSTHPLNRSRLGPAQFLASQLHYQQTTRLTNTTVTGYRNLNLFHEQADVWVAVVKVLQWNRNSII